jgi:beta-lactamase class D
MRSAWVGKSSYYPKRNMKHLFAAVILLLANQVHALDWQDSPEVAKLFDIAGLQGTFVLYDAATDRLIGHDRSRAETRFIPASTFKIPNSLIGLSVGAVKTVDEVLPYGGKPQPIKAWEQDMGLREAINVSNVPVYQELARCIGLERMRDNVAGMGFGNGEIGTVVDNFWLVGPLQISAVEQAEFLARLARNELPFPKDAQTKVREIIQLEQGNGWTLYGKTGWVNVPNPGIGWWVGWVIKESRVYSFALNIDIMQASDAAKRIELGKASLKALGVL